MLNNNVLKKDQIQFFLGYSGWSEHQLDDELKVNSWVVIHNDQKSDIIGMDSKDIWKKQMMQLGGEYMIWSNAPENPNFN